MKYDLLNNRTLELNQEECAESPRQWDNLTKMIFFGAHKHIGDKHNLKASHYNGWRELRRAVEKEYDVACIKVIYGYSHSGLTISTTPFSCPWDSGILGFAIITKKDLRNNYSIKRCTKKYIDYGNDIHIEGEIETLDQYIGGEVYYFNIENEDGVTEDSCGGFYGSDIKENGVLDHIGEADRKYIEKELG